MGKARRFLLLPVVLILVFLLFRIDDQNRESAPLSPSYSGDQTRISQDEGGLRQRMPQGSEENRPRGLPPNRTSKRSGDQNDRTSFLDVVLRPQGWVRTAGQRSGRLDPNPELRTEN